MQRAGCAPEKRVQRASAASFRAHYAKRANQKRIKVTKPERKKKKYNYNCRVSQLCNNKKNNNFFLTSRR